MGSEPEETCQMMNPSSVLETCLAQLNVSFYFSVVCTEQLYQANDFHH